MPNIYQLLRNLAKGFNQTRAISQWVEQKAEHNLIHNIYKTKDLNLGEHPYDQIAQSDDLLATYSNASQELCVYKISEPATQKLWSCQIENPEENSCKKLIISKDGVILFINGIDNYLNEIRLFVRGNHIGTITLRTATILRESIHIVGTRVLAFSHTTIRRYDRALYAWDIEEELKRTCVPANKIEYLDTSLYPNRRKIHCNEYYYVVAHCVSVNMICDATPITAYSLITNQIMPLIINFDLEQIDNINQIFNSPFCYEITSSQLIGHQLFCSLEFTDFSNPASDKISRALYQVDLQTNKKSLHILSDYDTGRIYNILTCIDDFVFFYSHQNSAQTIYSYDLQNKKIHLLKNEFYMDEFKNITSTVIGNTVMLPIPDTLNGVNIFTINRQMNPAIKLELNSDIALKACSNLWLEEGKALNPLNGDMGHIAYTYTNSKLLIYYRPRNYSLAMQNIDYTIDFNNEVKQQNTTFGVRIHDFLLSPNTSEEYKEDEVKEEKENTPNKEPNDEESNSNESLKRTRRRLN